MNPEGVTENYIQSNHIIQTNTCSLSPVIDCSKLPAFNTHKQMINAIILILLIIPVLCFLLLALLQHMAIIIWPRLYLPVFFSIQNKHLIHREIQRWVPIQYAVLARDTSLQDLQG